MEYQHKPYQCTRCGQWFGTLEQCLKHQTFEEIASDCPHLVEWSLEPDPNGVIEA